MGKSADILNKFHSALIAKFGTTKKVFHVWVCVVAVQ